HQPAGRDLLPRYRRCLRHCQVRRGQRRTVMTNIVVGLCSIVFVLVTAIGSLGQAFVVHSRAQNAADLAALAAADAVSGVATSKPCEIAEEGVERSGGQMSDFCDSLR